MMKRDIITIGASAGGVEALRGIVKGLPSDLGASVFVVLHVPPHSPSNLPDILSHAGPLEAVHARDGVVFEPNRIYVAPPDKHMLLDAGRIVVRRGPKENRFRPSIDALFRSAAYVYDSQVAFRRVLARRDRVLVIVVPCDYNDSMKTAGIRELKAHLSSYLREIAAGEILLVTDRGRVIAEMRPPAAADRVIDPASARYAELAERGTIIPAAGQRDRSWAEWPGLGAARGTARSLLDAERDE